MIPRIHHLALLLLLALAFAPRIPSASAAAHPFGKWRVQVPDSSGVVGEEATLALHGDEAHIAYFQNQECALKYVVKVPGGWRSEYVEGPLEAPPVGYAPCPLPGSLKLDILGRPHLSYYRAFPGSLVYAEKWNDAWVKDVVDGPATSLGAYSSLALDIVGRPYISYYTGDAGGGVKFAHRSQTGWTIEFVGPAASTSTSIALDRDDVPHIAYMGTGLMYASRTPSGWITELVDATGGLECSLALDAAGAPHISYRGADGRLGHATRGAAGWVLESLEATQGARFTSLALDEFGRDRISYYDDVTRDLMFASAAGAGWMVQRVDSAGDVGAWSSLALGDKGRPRIACFDATRGDLHYAEEFGPISGKPSPVVTDDGRAPSTEPAAPSVGLAVTRAGAQPSFLDYTLPTASDVQLTVHDVSGRRVVVLLDGSAAAGRHRVTWSAPGLPSGMYFCRLRACGTTVTRSVLLLR